MLVSDSWSTRNTAVASRIGQVEVLPPSTQLARRAGALREVLHQPFAAPPRGPGRRASAGAGPRRCAAPPPSWCRAAAASRRACAAAPRRPRPGCSRSQATSILSAVSAWPELVVQLARDAALLLLAHRARGERRARGAPRASARRAPRRARARSRRAGSRCSSAGRPPRSARSRRRSGIPRRCGAGPSRCALAHAPRRGARLAEAADMLAVAGAEALGDEPVRAARRSPRRAGSRTPPRPPC